MRQRAARAFAMAALVSLAGCGPQGSVPPEPPSGGEAAEPSTVVASDIAVSGRASPAAGAPVASPAATAPVLAVETPPTIPAPPATASLPPGVPPGVAFARRRGNPRQGLAFALNNCRPCHVVAPTAAGQASPVRFADAPDFRTIANRPGMTPFGLNVWLTNPHPTMPTLRLTPKEASNVIAYILSLKR
jgi:hypothetical protein